MCLIRQSKKFLHCHGGSRLGFAPPSSSLADDSFVLAKIRSDFADKIRFITDHPHSIGENTIAARRGFQAVISIGSVDGFQCARALQALDLAVNVGRNRQGVAGNLFR